MSLGTNIKKLRLLYGETQEDLQLAIDVESKGTIANYETNQRIPDEENLVKIAKHFNVTPDELRYGNFEVNNRIKLPLDDKEKLKKMFDVLLPIAFSTEAIKNDNFEKAYSIHMSVYDSIISERSLDNDKDLDDMFKFYNKAADDNIPEAFINALWFIILIIYINNNKKIMEAISDYKTKRITEKKVLQSFLYDIYDQVDVRDLDIEVESIYECIKNGKLFSQTAELADYYNALIYVLGIVEENEISGHSQMIGGEMMCNLARIGNRYARDYLLFGIRQLNDEKDA